MNNIGYSIGFDEFLLLSSLKGSKRIKYLLNDGNKDIYREFTEGGKAAWTLALERLIGRKYVSYKGMDVIAIDEIINHMISICCEPDLTITQEKCSEDGQINIKTYYIATNTAIEVESDSRIKNSLVLTPYKTAVSAIKTLCEEIETAEAIVNLYHEPVEIRLDNSECMAFLNTNDKAGSQNLKLTIENGGLSTEKADVFIDNLVNRKNVNYLTFSVGNNETFESIGSVVSVFVGKLVYHIVLNPEDSNREVVILSGGFNVLYDNIESILKRIQAIII